MLCLPNQSNIQSSPAQQWQAVIKSVKTSPLLLKWCQCWANNAQNKVVGLLWLKNLSRIVEDFALNNYSAKFHIKAVLHGCEIQNQVLEWTLEIRTWFSSLCFSLSLCCMLKISRIVFICLWKVLALEGNCLGRNVGWVLFSKVAIAQFLLS